MIIDQFVVSRFYLLFKCFECNRKFETSVISFYVGVIFAEKRSLGKKGPGKKVPRKKGPLEKRALLVFGKWKKGP